MKTTIVMASFLVVAAIGCDASTGSTPNAGYYAGAAILYPYLPVYCENDEVTGIGAACFGVPGEMFFLPKSAPLPTNEKWCEWADSRFMSVENWYQWDARDIPVDQQKYYGKKVCYFQDRGQPKNINSLKR